MKKLDLTEILKEGQEVYSPVFGYGEVTSISYVLGDLGDTYPILVMFQIYGGEECFTKNGKYVYIDDDKDTTECVLFPSKEIRDWEKYLKQQKNLAVK